MMKRFLIMLGIAAMTAGTVPMSVPKTNPAVTSVLIQGAEAFRDEETQKKWDVLCKKLQVYCNVINWNTCPDPDTIPPASTTPDATAPDSTTPDSTTPDSTTPDFTAPEETLPAADESQPTSPETQSPAASPETPAPETQAPSLPETSAPETQAPSLPEASAPETQTPSLPEASDVHPYVLRIVELVNEERAQAGLNPVTLDASASQAAQVRAQEIVISFSHTRPDGRSCFTALEEQGIRYRTAGENIAWGQRSPEQVMDAWMNSPGHRANILQESFTHIGVGYYQENGINYWSQLFFR